MCQRTTVILALALLLLVANRDLTAQLIPENLKLSQKREVRIVPEEVRIQDVAGNEGLDLVVWGSSMNDGDSAHPVLYFAILQDSAIVIEPTRMTGLESWPNRFVQVLPLSGRWIVLWTNDTGTDSRTHSLLVNPDGTFGTPFELWNGHPVTRHGAKTARLGARDFVCWSDTGRIETVGRWLDHDEVVPGPRITVDSGYLYLTRDYCSNIEGGLIETSIGRVLRLRENGSIEGVSIPAIADSVDTYNIPVDCSIYTARGTTIRHFASILDEESEVSAFVGMESWLTTAPAARIHVNSDESVSISTLLKPDVGYSSGQITVYERRYFLDASLQVVSDTTIQLPTLYGNSHHSHPMEYASPSSRNARLPDNGSYRDFSIHRSSYPLVVPILFGDHPTNGISEFTGPFGGAILLRNPFSLIQPSVLRRGASEQPVVYFSEHDNRPKLSSPTSRVMRFTRDESPSITHLDGRIFASWLSSAHDTLVRTVELTRSGDNLRVEDVPALSDSGSEKRWINSRRLHSVGPITIREIKWQIADRSYTEISALVIQDRLPRWNTIYVDSIGADSSQFVARSYYEPDNDAAWIVFVEQFYFSKVIWPPNIFERKTGVEKVRIFRIAGDGHAVDTIITIPPPSDVEGLPPHPGNIGYVPVNTNEYIVISRPGQWKATGKAVVDSLVTPIGTVGKLAPDFGNYLLEPYGTGSTARNNAALWIKTIDVDADTSTLSTPYTPRNDGIRNLQILVRRTDSVISLLYSWNGGIRTLTRHRGEWHGEQDITAGSVEAHTPTGVFVEDALWVVYQAKAGNSYQIYVNGVIPDNGVSSASSGFDLHSDRLTFSVNYLPGALLLSNNTGLTSGYLVDLYGRVVKRLDQLQIRGEKRIGTDDVPTGVHLVVLCSEGCVGRTVQVVR